MRHVPVLLVCTEYTSTLQYYCRARRGRRHLGLFANAVIDSLRWSPEWRLGETREDMQALAQ